MILRSRMWLLTRGMPVWRTSSICQKQEFHFLPRLKGNHKVNPDKSGQVEVSTLAAPLAGRDVQLRVFGLVRVFQKQDAKGQIEHWASSDLEMNRAVFEQSAKACWGIESYHRRLKQCCGVERAEV